MFDRVSERERPRARERERERERERHSKWKHVGGLQFAAGEDGGGNKDGIPLSSMLMNRLRGRLLNMRPYVWQYRLTVGICTIGRSSSMLLLST